MHGAHCSGRGSGPMALSTKRIARKFNAAIKVALDDLPPLFFAALRFFLAAVPLVFFLKRPKVAWSHLAAYGGLIGAGQFGLMYIALKSDISPGLASLVIQIQVFLTMVLADPEDIKTDLVRVLDLLDQVAQSF